MPKHLNTADDFEMVAIERLIPAPYNPNAGDFGAIHESIEANGFFGALVVSRRTRHVLAGNHRLAVALKMGYESLPVTWVDVDLDGEKRILLADNRTSRLGNDNPNALAELLAELAGTDKGLSGTGFDGDDLDSLLNDLSRENIYNPNLNPNQSTKIVTTEQMGKKAQELEDHFAAVSPNYQSVMCPHCAQEFHVKL